MQRSDATSRDKQCHPRKACVFRVCYVHAVTVNSIRIKQYLLIIAWFQVISTPFSPRNTRIREIRVFLSRCVYKYILSWLRRWMFDEPQTVTGSGINPDSDCGGTPPTLVSSSCNRGFVLVSLSDSNFEVWSVKNSCVPSLWQLILLYFLWVMGRQFVVAGSNVKVHLCIAVNLS